MTLLSDSEKHNFIKIDEHTKVIPKQQTFRQIQFKAVLIKLMSFIRLDNFTKTRTMIWGAEFMKTLTSILQQTYDRANDCQIKHIIGLWKVQEVYFKSIEDLQVK